MALLVAVAATVPDGAILAVNPGFKLWENAMWNLAGTVNSEATMRRLYTLAFGCGVAGMVIGRVSPANSWTEGLFVLAGIFFGSGFCVRIAPILKRIWSSAAGKWAIGALNVAVWFIAHVPARLAVAKALGLPPQDFEMTVSIWTVAVYPAVWVVFVSILALGLCAGLMLALCVLHLSTLPLITEAIDVLAGLLSGSVGNSLTTKKRREAGTQCLAHVAGSATLAIAGAAILQVNASMEQYYIPAIPWIAYVADYQEAAAYPGIPKNSRVRLHENGVVSYAVKEGWAVRIVVAELPQTTDVLP